MKPYVPMLIVLLFVSTSLMGVSNQVWDSMINVGEMEQVIKSTPIDSPHLNIESVTGGLGATIVIKNEGNIDVSNVVLSIQVTGGFIIMPRIMEYEIPILSANESTKVSFKIFGIGLGLMVTKLPKITITVCISDKNNIEKTVVARILGPFVKIVGIIFNNGSFDGYTLFPVEGSTNTYLINNSGEIVHIWESKYIQGLAGYLLENGNLLRSDLPKFNPTFFGGGITGRVEIFDWNSTLLWYFEYSDSQHCLHHDVEMLPNGNIMMIAWEYKTGEEAITAGRDPDLISNGEIWPDHIIEVEPTGTSGGNIVWEWHVWDHLIQDYDPTKENYGIVADHPELIDINFVETLLYGDWNHINSIDYNEDFDQILISSRNFNEIWVIDHSTTTEEAASHTGGNSGKGGDILYRWGNPNAYRAGSEIDQKLYRQHDAQWIEPGLPGEGNILVFNNGGNRPDGKYSSVDEIVPPVDSDGNYFINPGSTYDPEEPIWSYTAENPTDFFASYLSSAQRIPNGNTLICDGPHGFFFEVTPEKEIVWEYINMFPDPIFNKVFTIHRYAPDYPGLKNLFH